MRSLSSSRAVSMTIGVLRVSWRARRRRQTSMPGAFGSIQSSTTRSGVHFIGDDQRFFAILRDGDAIAFLLQIVFEQLRERRLRPRRPARSGVGHGRSQSERFGVGARTLGGDLLAGDEIVDVFGDVGGVIADALDVLGDEQQMRARVIVRGSSIM